jgi:tripartite-type tricarboxylate transporter receptor subunit TctC
LPHFFAVLFARSAGLEMQHVSYRGGAAALADLLGGQIPIVFTSTNDLFALHRTGRVRVLATSDSERSPFLPDVPTFGEAGYDIRGTGWFGLFASAKSPADEVERLNEVVVAAIRKPEIGERILALGLRPTGTTIADFAEIQRRDSELWAPAVKASGFTPEH